MLQLKKTIGFILVMIPMSTYAMHLPEMDCLIEPNSEVDLSSSVNGVIEKIHVKRGDVVKKGQSVVQLEDSVERANVALAKAKANFTHEIDSKKTQVGYTQKRFNRIKALYKKKATSQSDHQDAENEAQQAKIELSKAKHGEQIARLELQRAVSALNRLNIRSPVDGIVVERYMSPGEAVEDKKIMRIAEVNPLKVEVIVPADYFGQIKPGMKAKLIPELLQEPVEAYVTLVDKIIDASSGTFDVRLRLPNPDHKLPGGLKCRVIFEHEASDMPHHEADLDDHPDHSDHKVDTSYPHQINLDDI